MKKKRAAVCGAVLIMLCLFLAGCIPESYSKEEKEAVLRSAGEKMQEFFEENLQGAEIVSSEPINSMSEDQYAYALTEYVKGTLLYREKTYQFVVNIADGEIYTSMLYDSVMEKLMDEILESMEIKAAEANPAGSWIYYVKNIQETKLSKSVFQNVFPSEDSEEEILRDIREGDGIYEANVRIRYQGSALLADALERKALSASLKTLNIYHLFEEAVLSGEEASSLLLLPCMSCEILQADYEKNEGVFLKNEIAGRDGFRVLYNATTRKKEGDHIAEYSLRDEDVLLHVTKGYIELSCEKEEYQFYLFAEDPEVMERYVYTRCHRYNLNKEEEYERGIWRSLSVGNVFANQEGIGFPYQFDRSTGSEYGSGNRIYTEAEKGK